MPGLTAHPGFHANTPAAVDAVDDKVESFTNDELLLELGAVAQPATSAPHSPRGASAMAPVPLAAPASAGRGRNARPGSGAAGRRRRQQLPLEALPKVAIVGRPNVGKSAMFNRLAGERLAVVYDYPGVTRDRLYTRAFWGDKEYVLIDTGGLMSDATRLPLEQRAAAMASISADGLPAAIERQAAAGVAEAAAVVLLVDGQAGLQPGDREILGWLRAQHPDKPVTLAVNKCESPTKADMQAAEFWELGLQPHAVSAISGTGTGEMLDALVATLPAPDNVAEEDVDAERPMAVAIVGRPNVGKSSLLNSIAGEERVIVCDLSGTTRDAVDTKVTLADGRQLTLIDTAGVRKRARVADSADGAEQMSVDRALRAVSRAEVAVLVVDGSEGVTQQDFRLSTLMANAGKAVVVVVNKWDRVDQEKWDPDTYAEEVKAQLRHINWSQVVCTTASKGKRVDEVVSAVFEAGAQYRRRVPTATLNLVVREAVAWKPPPSTGRGAAGRQGRVYYATQAATCPPTFVLFVNDSRLFGPDYRRYIERNLRENIGFPGTPLRLLWRGKPTSSGGSGQRRRSAGGAAGGGEADGGAAGSSAAGGSAAGGSASRGSRAGGSRGSGRSGGSRGGGSRGGGSRGGGSRAGSSQAGSSRTGR